MEPFSLKWEDKNDVLSQTIHFNFKWSWQLFGCQQVHFIALYMKVRMTVKSTSIDLSLSVLSESKVFQKCFMISFTSSSFGTHCQSQGSVSYQRHGLHFHHFILTRNLCFLLCIDAESLWDLLLRLDLARPTFRNWPTGSYCRSVSTMDMKGLYTPVKIAGFKIKKRR